MKRGLKLVLFAFVLLASLSSISAEHQISPASLSSNLNEKSQYTITITNTDTYADTGASTNITRVDIVLPSGFVFAEGTNATSSASTFSNTSTTLSWINSSYVLGSSTGGDNAKTFSFYANATTLGTFNITIATTNSSGVFQKGVSLAVSDSSVPVVNLVSPENSADDVDGVIVFECNATDNTAVSSMKLSITSNGSELYSNIIDSNGTSAQAEWDYAFDSAGTFKWNCFANDTSNNSVWGTNRTLTISAIAAACSPNWNCSEWDVCANENQTRICNDLNSCGNNSTKPAESQACVLPICTADWTCTSWSPTECPKNGTQQRICTDNNSCSDATGKPSESKTCEPQESSAWIFIAIISVLVLAGFGAAAFFYLKNRNLAENMPVGNQGNQQQDYGYNYS